MDTDTNLLDILLVEDNEADIKLTQLAFEKGNIKNRIHIARDGEEALSFVAQKKKEYKNGCTRPDLILLDINLPKLDGFEVLQKIKSDPQSSCIPVVMLTSSRSEQDVLNCYKHGASSYIPKPISFANFVEMINGFNSYWSKIAQLPPKSETDENLSS